MILSVAHSSTAFLAQPDSRYQHDNYVCIIDIIYNHVYYMIYIYIIIYYILYIYIERERAERAERGAGITLRSHVTFQIEQPISNGIADASAGS